MRIHHLALRTRDVRRLAAFYEGVLGLSPWVPSARGGEPAAPASNETRAWFDAGGSIVMIEAMEDGEPMPAVGSRELVCFEVSPETRETWEERLAASGVALEARTAFTLYFRDPDGRRVGVSHWPHARG